MGKHKGKKLKKQELLLPSSSEDQTNIPSNLLLPIRGSPGMFFGLPSNLWTDNYVGMPLGTEGNLLVDGGNGSGKSTIAKVTSLTWHQAMCVTDIKGEQSDFYEELYQKKLVTRPYIIFDPMQIDGPSYDPFWWLLEDDENNLIGNIWEIVLAIAPDQPKDIQPFWQETEQGVFAAALYYYFKRGLSFSETIIKIMDQPVSTLCKKMMESNDIHIRHFLGQITDTKPETLACVDRGLRNKLMLLATDPFISHAFRGEREGAVCFTWKDLDTHNIFLRIPEDKIEEWSGAVNLMFTQLIRCLERRPDQNSTAGTNNVQTLLLMDEFARFGKLNSIISALTTLRSKNVNICLMIQSMAQLDKIYGEYDRRIIFDNCQFQVILRANDAETQKYLSELIGDHITDQYSMSANSDDKLHIYGYSKNISKVWDFLVRPHELATLEDALLLTPNGFCRVKKFRLYDEGMKSMLLAEPRIIQVEALIPEGYVEPEDAEGQPTPKLAEAECNLIPEPEESISTILRRNEDAKLMKIEERSANADKKIIAEEHRQRQEQRKAKADQDRKVRHRNNAIGALVVKYFPSIQNLGEKTQVENDPLLKSLEAFLYVLSTDDELVEDLKDQAEQMMSEEPDGEWCIT